MSRTAPEPVAPGEISYIEPITVVSEPGERKGVRFQRFRVHPDFYISIHDDGRVRIESRHRDLTVKNLHNHQNGSTANIQTTPKLGDEDD
jgi:hypothetical protein